MTQTSGTEAEPVSFGDRLVQLALDRPDDVALTVVTVSGAAVEITYRELDRASDAMAAEFADRHGVECGDLAVVAMPAGLAHAASTFGLWKLGAALVPVNPRTPAWELTRLLDVAKPRVVAGDLEAHGYPVITIDEVEATLRQPWSGSRPPVTPPRGIVFTSGGSTGVPKLINGFGRGALVPGRSHGALGAAVGFGRFQRVLSTAPMYHGLGFGIAYFALHDGSPTTVLEKFTPDLFFDAVEKYRIQHATVVPTMMQRLLKSERFETADLSSLEHLLHAGSSCPDWVKDAWIRKIGGSKVVEYYSATEVHGFTVIRGDEWLERRGSVGRPLSTTVKILDANEREVSTGEIGEIYMRKDGQEGPTYEYVNRERGPVSEDGFASVGDLGRVDEDGYLYIADRRTDMIVSGGANVFPAEVESALLRFPGVRDAAVVGLADPDWGHVVHAIVSAEDGAHIDPSAVVQHCKDYLMPYKVPKSVELVDQLPRNEAGKIRRSDLVKERQPPTS